MYIFGKEFTMDEKYKKSFSEVYEILNLMPDTIINKIPEKMRNIIENERDKNYKVIISEPLNKDDFQYETIVFLGMLYRDFLCDDNEKKSLQQNEIKLENQYNEELRKKYNTDDLFKHRKKVNIEVSESLPIKAEEKNWYKKIFNLVKGIFK